jgi:CubicO group peptidase (beta-lactamase class C family)
MNMKNISILSFLVFFLLFSCKPKEVIINNLDEFGEYLEDEMDAQNIPAMAVLLFEEDSILHEQYLGSSNLSANQSLAADHLFLLASISKVITATALLQLYEQGLFALDDKINDYLPFDVQVPNATTDITFRMLLTHTSAIADGSALDNQYFYGSDPNVELDSFMENYLVPGGSFYDANENFHDAEPGDAFQYSNEGSALLAVLVEAISNKDFNTYCKDHIFTPLGMNRTSWRLDEIQQNNWTIVQPYNYQSGSYSAIDHYTFTDYPNGGLRTTARDLAIFLSAFVQNGQANGYQLLKNSTLGEMLQAQIPDLDPTVGLHIFLMNEEHQLWGHDGGEQGVATIMGFNKSTKKGAIILSNQGEADLDEILKEAYEMALKL